MKAALFLLPVLSATAAFALKQEPGVGKIDFPRFQKAAACAERPEFLTEARTEIVGTIDKLPKLGVLVARDAEYYVEGQTESGDPIRMHAYQSFEDRAAGTRVLCGDSAKGMSERFSLFAPTLIDTTNSQVGNSVWQFQLMANGDKFSSWNMKSPVSSSAERLDKVLRKMGSKYRLYQTARNEYEMMVIQESHGVTEYLSIRYDAVSSIK